VRDVSLSTDLVRPEQASIKAPVEHRYMQRADIGVWCATCRDRDSIRAAQRIDHAAKLDEASGAHALDDASKGPALFEPAQSFMRIC
jgi:hypothetical protein